MIEPSLGPSHELASRIGKAVEYMVAAMVVLGSRGTVNASTAMVDDAGVDVTFFNRSGSIDLQVKSRTLDAKTSQDDNLVANVRSATFRPREDLFILFVIVDLAAMALGPLWLVPSMEFATRANVLRQGEILRITASMKLPTFDKWAEFRVERPALATRIKHLVDGSGTEG